MNARGAQDHQIRETLEEAWERGHDAVLIENYTRPGGKKPETVIVVRDLSQLRSPNAVFDPARRDSTDLLAGLAALGILTPAAFGPPARQRQ